MNIKWIEKANNPFYPLPPDYEELTDEGMRQARVNACRLWLVKNKSPQEIGDAFASGIKFFDMWYLWPDLENDFDPLFYDDEPLKTPDFHFDILRSWATNSRNITIAPRGSAKSFLTRKSCLFRMLSRPVYTILYATSTNDNARGTGQALKDQFLHNTRIHSDWDPEFADNRIVPKRGEAPFGTEMMQLRNGSWLRAISAESRQRGGRPRRYVLDDPEYDPKASTSMSLIRQYMDDLLFKVVLPMVMRSGCGVDWLATFVSRRHFAWHALQTEANLEGEEVAVDPRFDLWSRMIVRAAYEDEAEEIKSCWPEMWPATIADKKADPKLKDRVSLEEIRKIIGIPNFLAEYMARPGEGEGQFFPELNKEKHGWWISDVDMDFEESPTTSSTRIHWYEGEVHRDMPISDFLRTVRLFMTVDTSWTATKDSDYKVACLMAIDSNNDLFVLDLWSGQCQEAQLINAIFHMADQWRCPTIHPEAIKGGHGLCNALVSLVNTRASDMAGVTHLPGIKKLNPGQAEKVSKISALNLRFEHGKVKMPLWNRKPQWVRLYNQIEQFNPDAKDGGLQHDDEIDSIAMSQYVLRGRLRKSLSLPAIRKDPVERLKEGEIRDENGSMIALGVDWSKVSADDMFEIIGQEKQKEDNGTTRI